MTFIWTQGMKRVSSTHRMRWEELLYRRLSGHHSSIAPGGQTKSAEDGLKLGTCVYYFVGRCDPDWGSGTAVAFLEAPRTVDGAAVCPFDTGGLYHNHHPGQCSQLSEAEKAALVNQHSRRIDEYEPVMRMWGHAAYDEWPPYPKGRSPSVNAVPEIDAVHADDARAWTWEARVPATSANDHQMDVIRAYLEPQNTKAYLVWLQDTPILVPAEKEEHFSFFVSVYHEVSGPPALEMNRWLAEGGSW